MIQSGDITIMSVVYCAQRPRVRQHLCLLSRRNTLPPLSHLHQWVSAVGCIRCCLSVVANVVKLVARCLLLSFDLRTCCLL